MKLINIKILFNIIISTMFSLLIISCSEEQIITENGTPVIEKIIKNPTYVGDTITIYGSYLRDAGLDSYVQFINGINGKVDTIIHSTKCLQWTVSKVKLIVPLATSTKINLVCKGDTTNNLEITINRLPELKTVEISSGKFLIGSYFGLKDEQPPHEIEISKPLIVSIFEINQFFYEQVSGNNPSLMKDHSLPVDSLNWIDAINFCNQLSVIDGLIPAYTIFGENVKWDTNASGWRLPTEAEWEYLCRANDTSDYSGSTDLNSVGWYSMNSGLKSHPSGLKKPNLFGLYDMHGNLWEWCWDYYNSDYYAISPYTNPVGPNTGTRHIARGGSYGDGNSLARASNRFFPGNPIERTGFRIVRTKFN